MSVENLRHYLVLGDLGDRGASADKWSGSTAATHWSAVASSGNGGRDHEPWEVWWPPAPGVTFCLKLAGTLVLQPQEAEFCQQPVGVGSGLSPVHP